MSQRIRDIGMTVAVLAAVAAGASAVAGAASDDDDGNSSNQGAAAQTQNRPPGPPPGGRHPGERPLTGDTAAKVKKAAEDRVAGGTVLRVETDAEGSPYEAHVRKSDGSEVTVKVNRDFEVTAVEEGHGKPPAGGPPPGAPQGNGSGQTQPDSFVQ